MAVNKKNFASVENSFWQLIQRFTKFSIFFNSHKQINQRRTMTQQQCFIKQGPPVRTCMINQPEQLDIKVHKQGKTFSPKNDLKVTTTRNSSMTPNIVFLSTI